MSSRGILTVAHLASSFGQSQVLSKVRLCFACRSSGSGGAQKDHINIRIVHAMICGIPLVSGLGTRMSDPYVYVVVWAPIW